MLRDGQWAGEAAYIIGGGPSLKGFRWSLLDGRKNILAINASMFQLPMADVFFTEDFRFIERFHSSREWVAFRGVKVFHALLDSYATEALFLDASIEVVHRKREDKFWSRSLEEGLSVSSNSGVGAVNLACVLGADPIYLLGFDCRRRVVGENPNYHDAYPQDWRMPVGQEDQYRSDFEHWVSHWTRDRRVVNLTTEECTSAITCWPRMDRDSFLKTGTPAKIWVDLKSSGKFEVP